ncbi:hypothetical protein L0F63_005939, partial [Massospora cicadina]
EYELLYSIDLFKTSAIAEVKKKKTPTFLRFALQTKEARDSEPFVPFEKLAFASRPNPPEISQQSDLEGFWERHFSSSDSQSAHGLSDDQGFTLPVADLVSDSSEYDHELEFGTFAQKDAGSSPPGVSFIPQTPQTPPKLTSNGAVTAIISIPDLGSLVVMQGVL